MKRVIALLLALLMVFALVACAAKEESKPADDKADAPAASDDAAAPADDSAATEEPRELVYMCSTFAVVWCKNTETAMKTFEEELNFKLLSTDVDGDLDLWITNVETYCDQGVEGFVLSGDQTIVERTLEITKEYGIPYMFMDTAVRDKDGKLLTSGVELDAYQVGADTATYIVENYKTHFGVDKLENVGIVSIHYSTYVSFEDRSQGAEDVLLAEFPDAQLFKADLVAQGNMSADSAYNETSPIFASHPEIQYWLVVGVVDDWGLGATRAIESVGLTDKAMVATAGGEALVLEWDNGYDADGTGCWKSCCYYEAYDFVSVLIPGMISVVNGETTVEDIWNEHDEETGYASVKISGVNVTKDNYLDYIKMRY